jgi:hypothetical protein
VWRRAVRWEQGGQRVALQVDLVVQARERVADAVGERVESLCQAAQFIS